MEVSAHQDSGGVLSLRVRVHLLPWAFERALACAHVATLSPGGFLYLPDLISSGWLSAELMSVTAHSAAAAATLSPVLAHLDRKLGRGGIKKKQRPSGVNPRATREEFQSGHVSPRPRCFTYGDKKNQTSLSM